MAWTVAARADVLGERGLAGVICDGVPLALSRVGDQYFAMVDRCPHSGVALSQGVLVQGFIECPQHFALFDVRTGASGGGVTMNSARVVPARLAGDVIEVDLEGVSGGIAQ